MGSAMEATMRQRLQAQQAEYEAQWAGGRGSHHPDYDPYYIGEGAAKATRPTEELYLAIVKNDIKKVYEKVAEGADVNFVFGPSYRCPEGYTPLMGACLRGHYECCQALLRAGADPNFCNSAGDLTLFWALDGGVQVTQLLVEHGAQVDARTQQGWTPLSYARAMGKYGAVEEKGIYPEDVLLYYGAKEYGSAPPAAPRSPRESFNPRAQSFSRERGSYQNPMAHP